MKPLHPALAFVVRLVTWVAAGVLALAAAGALLLALAESVGGRR